MDYKEKCPHCGATMKAYWHTLTPGLVETFKKIIDGVKAKGLNSVHLQKDLDLSKSEYNNAQKLRYWGLIYYADREKTNSGQWLITRLGGQFIRCESDVPKKIKTFRNHIEEKSEEKTRITDYYRHWDIEYWQTNYKDFDICQGRLV